ncbi:hypothetical protein MRX96_012019 [Rhipicephalus microplus]
MALWSNTSWLKSMECLCSYLTLSKRSDNDEHLVGILRVRRMRRKEGRESCVSRCAEWILRSVARDGPHDGLPCTPGAREACPIRREHAWGAGDQVLTRSVNCSH